MVCKRKLWLFANGINMELTSDLVYEGKLLHKDSYPHRSGEYEEIEMGGVKIDFYDPKTIHEIKKSDKIENAHSGQLKYYLYVFFKKRYRRSRRDSGVSGLLWVLKLVMVFSLHQGGIHLNDSCMKRTAWCISSRDDRTKKYFLILSLYTCGIA